MKKEELVDHYRGQLKTSSEWVGESFFKDWQITVSDPDGWDRVNFDYSWDEEQISLEEFLSRLRQSTCRGISNQFFQFYGLS